MLKTILKISRHAENHVKHFKECWNIVFKMHYGFQHILKFSFQHALQISEHSEISRHAENHIKHFKECWNIVFKMHYRFQHILKFSFSTCITDFRTFWNFQNAFLRCFQHISNIKIHLWYEPCWKLCWGPCQIFQSVLKTILKISRLGSYCRKRHDVTITWPFENIFHRTNTVKI